MKKILNTKRKTDNDSNNNRPVMITKFFHLLIGGFGFITHLCTYANIEFSEFPNHIEINSSLTFQK